MDCPKCHKKIDENMTVCPHCHKVLALECPNCHTLGEYPVCEKCGYTILVKCSKCSKINPYEKQNCTKCGFSLSTSLGYQECESDDFASIIVKFGSLRAIKKQLKSQELYSKFNYKLKNLLLAQLKGIDCKLITYGDVFAINICKELSFPTSSNKAIRLALKIINAFVDINNNTIEQLGTPLNLTLTVIKKGAEELQELKIPKNNVKLLTVKKSDKKYLRGFQIITDQFICDEVSKTYKTDSLYSQEENGKTTMFYEIVLDSYILPPNSNKDEDTIEVMPKAIKKTTTEEKDLYTFKVFDINAKCKFTRTSTVFLQDSLNEIDFKNGGKIVALRSDKPNQYCTKTLKKYFELQDLKVLSVNCSEEMNYKPWGIFEALFRDNYNLPLHNKFIDTSKINDNIIRAFGPIFEFLHSKPAKAMTPEDARFTYMEHWNKFLSTLNNTVIIINGFENIDDTTLQVLELYFDKFTKIKPNFVFITTKEHTVHNKIKGLLRTSCYTEITLNKTDIDNCLSTLKSDATDFIQSFYFEKIKDNFNGSLLYFNKAIEYLKDMEILIEFENKLIVKNKKSVVIPKDLETLYKARIKSFSKNMDISLILAYSSILGARIDTNTLQNLGIKDVEKNCEKLAESGLATYCDNILHINNFDIVCPVIKGSLKKEIEEFLAKNIIAQLGKGLDDTTLILAMAKLGAYKEEYLTLWKNSNFAIKTGDYDAYLKNCLGFLSLVEHIETNIPKEDIETNKKEVYDNILMFLYSYSPSKIYFIENMLLVDAINQEDNEKIVKLSNLMLQGALISSNYTDALGLLHNILSRMPNPTLYVDGAINTKFLLLSLVNIEILYNIGDFKTCVEVAEDILRALSLDIIDKIKPASFSTNLFISHILETLRLVAFAKLFIMDKNIQEYFDIIKEKLGTDLPDKDCVLAIKDTLAGKAYSTGNIEEYPAFSKVILLIIQELTGLNGDYKKFAQNIYQAKLLATDIRQRELELFCDLLIAYAYSQIGVDEKAEHIYSDVIDTADKSAMFNILCLAKYFAAKQKINPKNSTPNIEEALLYINDVLALIQKFNNQSAILFTLVEKLYINIAKEKELSNVDLESEEQKILPMQDALKLLF